MRGTLEVGLKAHIHPSYQNCTDWVQKAETVLSAVIYIYIYILDIALWCKNQIEHSIWDESLLFSNCARSLEYSSSSTLAGLSYHICGKLEVAFKGSPSSQHQHCTDEAQKAETVLSAVSYIYIYINIYIYITNCRQYCFGLLGLISAVLMARMKISL